MPNGPPPALATLEIDRQIEPVASNCVRMRPHVWSASGYISRDACETGKTREIYRANTHYIVCNRELIFRNGNRSRMFSGYECEHPHWHFRMALQTLAWRIFS